jgi:hypothetical protein
MTPAREREVIGHIRTLGTVEEANAFRDALRGQGEQLTAQVYADLLAKIDQLAKREGKR